MFWNCSSLLYLPDISKWNTSNVINMNNMFSQCSRLKKVPDITVWNVSNVTDFAYMFSYCCGLESLHDISKWNFSNFCNITCFRTIFIGCDKDSEMKIIIEKIRDKLSSI